MVKTRTFITGRSQAIRLPLEYRLPDEDIIINRIGDTITLTPASKQIAAVSHALDQFTDDFMSAGLPDQSRSLPMVNL